MHKKQRVHWLSPNPDKTKLKLIPSSKFLDIGQRVHWLGPNPDKPKPKRFLASKFLHKKQRKHWLGPKSFFQQKITLHAAVF